MIFDHDDPVSFLKEQLEQRTKANPSYSLRAFAQRLGLSPGGLSLILASKKRLSPDRAAEVARSLDLGDREAQYFICLNQLNFAKSTSYRSQILEKILELRMEAAPGKNWEKAVLEVDQFKLISEWYGFPCFELITETEGPWPARKIASTLGIAQAEAGVMVECLKRLKLVEEVSDGIFKRVAGTVLVESANPNEALRSYYEGIHKKSATSIRDQGPGEKAVASQVFVADPDDLPKIKKLTDDYLDAVNAVAMNGKNRTVLYQALTNIFKLSPTLTAKKPKPKKPKTQFEEIRKEKTL